MLAGVPGAAPGVASPSSRRVLADLGGRPGLSPGLRPGLRWVNRFGDVPPSDSAPLSSVFSAFGVRFFLLIFVKILNV